MTYCFFGVKTSPTGERFNYKRTDGISVSNEDVATSVKIHLQTMSIYQRQIIVINEHAVSETINAR